MMVQSVLEYFLRLFNRKIVSGGSIPLVSLETTLEDSEGICADKVLC